MRYNNISINKKLLMFSFFVFILLSCIQNIKFYETGISSIRPFHIFSIIFVLFMIGCKRFILPNRIILLYIIYAIVISLAHIPKWGLDAQCIKYLFGTFILLIFCSVGTDLTLDDWTKVFTSAATILLIAVYINYVLNFNAIISFFRNPWSGHPHIETVMGGGVNLEATWIAIFGFVFYKSRMKFPYLILSVLLSSTYASRVGLMANIMCILWFFIPYIKKRNLLNYLIIGMLFLVIVLVLNYIGIFDVIINRFTNIGSDSDGGSVGRLGMWEYVSETIYRYPLGCGLGNCINALSKVAGRTFVNSSLHNVFLQNFIDLGLIGGCFYIIIIIGFIFKEFKSLFKNPFVAMLFSYIICSMLEFAGCETILFCILGIYLCLNMRTNKSDM